MPLPTNPNNTLVIKVLVTPVVSEMARVESAFTRTRMAGMPADHRPNEKSIMRRSILGHSVRSRLLLIELLVSTAIMITVTGAIFSLMNPAQKNAQAPPEVADMQQRMRVGKDTLFKEMMMSGAGPYQGPVTGSLINSLPRFCRAAWGTCPDPATGAGSFKTDVITLAYIPNTYSQTTISAHASTIGGNQGEPPAKLPADAGDLCGFAEGMDVIIFDTAGHWDTFTITDRLARKVLGAVGRGEDQRAAAVGDKAALQQAERIGDHPRIEHVRDRDRVLHHCARVLPRPFALHDSDHGKLLMGDAIGLHEAQHGDREHAGRAVDAERRLELALQAVGGIERGILPIIDLPLSACVISTVLHRPASIAAAAWRTCSMNEQPPTEVPSTQVGLMPR